MSKTVIGGIVLTIYEDQGSQFAKHEFLIELLTFPQGAKAIAAVGGARIHRYLEVNGKCC